MAVDIDWEMMDDCSESVWFLESVLTVQKEGVKITRLSPLHPLPIKGDVCNWNTPACLALST